MSNQQGDNPPSAAPAGAYGPGHTVLGEPAFVAEAAPGAFPPQGAFPQQAAFPPQGAPYAGAVVPPTVFDANAYVPPPNGPPPMYPVSPYAGGTAPAAGYGPPGAMPNAYGGPPPAYPAPPQQRAAASGASGPSMIVIGLAAFAVIGGLTTFLALRGRSSSESNDKPIPTIDVPPVATVPSDPGPGADPSAPPSVEEPPVVAPPAAVVTAPKPTATTPKPVPTATIKPTPTPVPTATVKPTPTPTTTTKTGKGPVLVPRHPPKR